VAGGLSRRLGIDVTLVRVVLVLAALSSGVGVVAYVAAWLLVPLEGQQSGIGTRAVNDRRGIAMAVAFVPALGALLVLLSAAGLLSLSSLTWALCLSGAGLVLVVRNADPEEKAWLHQAVEPLVAADRHGPRWPLLVARVVLAAIALGFGVDLLVHGHSTAASFRPLGGALLVIGAIVVLFGPWWARLARELVEERRARLRAEDRADMASRVHDSVLQTLALIQRSADDPKRVAQLARTQERELRSWLFDGTPPQSAGGAPTVASALELLAREVESIFPLSVDNVAVGDCPLDEGLQALVLATREAAMNAGKWSGASDLSLFAEVEADSVSIFVRDRGRGFDPAAVARDRRGITSSIVDRVHRQGGSATIRSAPGEGTEVELVMPRNAQEGRRASGTAR
jgi:signal transduction histidine kinase